MNDLYSFNKELNDKYKGNTVHQIQAETHCSSSDAVHLVHRMVSIEKEHFERNCEAVLDRYNSNSNLGNFIEAAGYIVAANAHFLTFDERYRRANDRAAAR